MKPESSGDKCKLNRTSVKAGSKLVRFDLYISDTDTKKCGYDVPDNIQHTFVVREGGSSYNISYELVNKGSGKIIKVGNWEN